MGQEEKRRGEAKIIKQRCKDLHWQQKQTQEVEEGEGEEEKEDQPLFTKQIWNCKHFHKDLKEENEQKEEVKEKKKTEEKEEDDRNFWLSRRTWLLPLGNGGMRVVKMAHSKQMDPWSLHLVAVHD